jgi:hypothetical protein
MHVNIMINSLYKNAQDLGLVPSLVQLVKVVWLIEDRAGPLGERGDN